MKKCSICSETFPLEAFTMRKNGYPFLECKSCRATEQRIKRKQYKQANPVKVKTSGRRYHLKKRYQMTPEDYDLRLENQGYRCAVCPTTDPGRGRQYFMVDHDHKCCPGNITCGECVRGLLCSNCNTALGMLQDNLEIIESLGRYLNG